MIKVALYKELTDFQLKVEFQIPKNGRIGVIGRSGSGKTTLLRLIAGLEKGRGLIEVGGVKWLEGERGLPPQRRSVGFLFQDYGLFPNMSVLENILYPARDREFANYLMEVTEITHLANRYPSQLSGGEQQRVALCRALIRRPQLLLLDEPLSALNPELREKLQEELERLHRELGFGIVIVSHHPGELYRLVDWVLELERGEVKRFGRPGEVLELRRGLRGRGRVLERRGKIGVLEVEGELVEVELPAGVEVGEVIELELTPTKIHPLSKK
jgi:molybdate transport system ATP-binding protein